ncbi:MAG: leucine-rich repeat domain-containing protein [bacterium]|nr:leucine-rich repeat domain-containing protein [bacterium]
MTREPQHTKERHRKAPRLISCLFKAVCTIIILLSIAAYRTIAVKYTSNDIVYNGYFGHTVIGTTNKNPGQYIFEVLGPSIKKEPKHFKIRPGTTAINNDISIYNCGIFLAAYSIELPEGLATIGSAAFKNTEGLKSIVIPNSVTFIDSKAFQGCTELESITLSNSLTAIPDQCFTWCKSLESIAIPASVNKIGAGSFEKCHSLKSITIPNSVSYIAGNVFAECSNLSQVTLSNRVTTLRPLTFYKCVKLKNIVIPDSVTTICARAFEKCTSLKTASVPSTAKIEKDAFPPHTKIIRRPTANHK